MRGMLRILHVVGARPNFVKIAPIVAALRQHADIEQRLVHTGQHYDRRMAGAFFDDLGLPAPDLVQADPVQRPAQCARAHAGSSAQQHMPAPVN